MSWWKRVDLEHLDGRHWLVFLQSFIGLNFTEVLIVVPIELSKVLKNFPKKSSHLGKFCNSFQIQMIKRDRITHWDSLKYTWRGNSCGTNQVKCCEIVKRYSFVEKSQGGAYRKTTWFHLGWDLNLWRKQRSLQVFLWTETVCERFLS